MIVIYNICLSYLGHLQHGSHHLHCVSESCMSVCFSQFLSIAVFLNTHISQGNAATHVTYVVMFSDYCKFTTLSASEVILKTVQH